MRGNIFLAGVNLILVGICSILLIQVFPDQWAYLTLDGPAPFLNFWIIFVLFSGAIVTIVGSLLPKKKKKKGERQRPVPEDRQREAPPTI